MGFLSGAKTINPRQLKDIFKKIGSLDSQEREHARGLFQQYQSGGIDKIRVEQAICSPKLNYADNIDSSEAEKTDRNF